MTVRRKARCRDDGAPLDPLQVCAEDVGRALSDCESGDPETVVHGRKEIAAYFVADVESGALPPVDVLAVVAGMLDGALSVDYSRHSNRESPVPHALGFSATKKFPAVQVKARKQAAREFVQDVRAGRTSSMTTLRTVARSLAGVLSVDFQKKANWRHPVAKAMGLNAEPLDDARMSERKRVRSMVRPHALFGRSLNGSADALSAKTGKSFDAMRKAIQRERKRIRGRGPQAGSARK